MIFYIFSRMATRVACEKRFLTLSFVCFTSSSARTMSSSARTMKVALPTKWERSRTSWRIDDIFLLGISSYFICVAIAVMLFLAKPIVRCPTRVSILYNKWPSEIPVIISITTVYNRCFSFLKQYKVVCLGVFLTFKRKSSFFGIRLEFSFGLFKSNGHGPLRKCS